MDIFEFCFPLEFARFDLVPDRGETVDDLVRVFNGDDALAAQHVGVNSRASDVFVVQPLIVVHRNGEIAREFASTRSGGGIVLFFVWVGH